MKNNTDKLEQELKKTINILRSKDIEMSTIEELKTYANLVNEKAMYLGEPFHLMGVLNILGFKVCIAEHQDLGGYVLGNKDEELGPEKIIFANAKKPVFEQRFITAHEFAHYLLSNKSKNADGIYMHIFQDNDRQSETITNIFASELLLPTHKLLEETEEKKELTFSDYRLISSKYGMPLSEVRRRINEDVLNKQKQFIKARH